MAWRKKRLVNGTGEGHQFAPPPRRAAPRRRDRRAKAHERTTARRRRDGQGVRLCAGARPKAQRYDCEKSAEVDRREGHDAGGGRKNRREVLRAALQRVSWSRLRAHLTELRSLTPAKMRARRVER